MKPAAALPAVLLALTLTSALAVGGAFVARLMVASARQTHRGSELQPAAELALIEAVAGWDSLARSEQAIGTTQDLPSTASGTAITAAWVTRTSAELYWLVAESRTGSPPTLHRRVGVVVRFSGGQPSVAFPRGWSELP